MKTKQTRQDNRSQSEYEGDLRSGWQREDALIEIINETFRKVNPSYKLVKTSHDKDNRIKSRFEKLDSTPDTTMMKDGVPQFRVELSAAEFVGKRFATKTTKVQSCLPDDAHLIWDMASDRFAVVYLQDWVNFPIDPIAREFGGKSAYYCSSTDLPWTKSIDEICLSLSRGV